MKNRALKIGLVVIEIAIAAVLMEMYVFVPIECSHVKTTAERLISRFLVVPPTLRMNRQMRLVREQVDECVERQPHDVDLRMEAAAFALIVNDQNRAIEHYKAALEVDIRPELYLNLGKALYDAGRKQEAIEAFAWLTAFTSFMINYDPDIPWSSERVIDLIPVALQADVTREAQRLRMSTLRR